MKRNLASVIGLCSLVETVSTLVASAGSSVLSIINHLKKSLCHPLHVTAA
jgi:hypothetical protein